MGFHSFWLPENHFGGETSIPSPLMLLAGVAARTRRIGLGSTSYLLPIRHPIQAAEEVAVLDRMSGGRVILGIGRGIQKSMFTVFDIPESEKRKRFRQALDIMQNAWQGNPIAFDGDDPVHLAPLPVQKPWPSIWVAAFGPLALKQAGSLGLPYLASPMETLSSLQENYQRHSIAAREAGHEAVRIRPVMRTVFISQDSHLTQTVRDALTKEVISRNRIRRTSLFQSDPDDWVDQAALIGSPAYVSEKLQEYRDTLGLTHLIARGRIPGLSDADHLKSMEALLKIL